VRYPWQSRSKPLLAERVDGMATAERDPSPGPSSARDGLLRHALVPMVQPTEPGQRDGPRSICSRRTLAAGGRLLAKPEMRAVVVVIVDIIAEQPTQVALAEHDDMIEQLAADAADPALGDAVLPGAAMGSPRGCDAERPERGDDLRGEIESRSKTRYPV
jgi:hypothetical protein